MEREKEVVALLKGIDAELGSIKQNIPSNDYGASLGGIENELMEIAGLLKRQSELLEKILAALTDR